MFDSSLPFRHERPMKTAFVTGSAGFIGHAISTRLLSLGWRVVGLDAFSDYYDVTLKERRRLVMMVRETPFNLAHLRNMTAVTEMGGIVFPPLPAFYHRPSSIEEMVDHTVARVLKLFDIEVPGPHWEGT